MLSYPTANSWMGICMSAHVVFRSGTQLPELLCRNFLLCISLPRQEHKVTEYAGQGWGFGAGTNYQGISKIGKLMENAMIFQNLAGSSKCQELPADVYIRCDGSY